MKGFRAKDVALAVSAVALATGCHVGEASRSETNSESSGKADDPGAASHGERAEALRALAEEHGVEPVEPAPAVPDELFELGRVLAFDKILSGNKNISCMTCHHPSIGSDDDRALPRGEGGSGLGEGRGGGPIIPRNAPALFNLHALDTQFWDSRVEIDEQGHMLTPAGDALTPEMVETFEYGAAAAQAMFPVTSPHEMRGEPGENEIADAEDLPEVWSLLMERLGDIPEYVAMFEAAYPGESFEEMTFAHAANAIAAFEIRAFEATESPWQAFLRGYDYALFDEEIRGAFDFFENGCADCHSGPMLSDEEHHNVGLAQFGPGKGDGPTGVDDFGRERVSGDERDRYAFRTPTLHNVALTAPYGHDGQFADLRDFVVHYEDPARSVKTYDITEHVNDEALWDMQLDNAADVIATLDPLAGVELDSADNVVAFLTALTDFGSRDLSRFIPSSVPSGLPVAD